MVLTVNNSSQVHKAKVCPHKSTKNQGLKSCLPTCIVVDCNSDPPKIVVETLIYSILDATEDNS